jgi:hypothetical protein
MIKINFIFSILLIQLNTCNVNDSSVSNIIKPETKNLITNCSYQNEVSDLGIGLLIWEGECKDSISFYSDTLLSNSRYSICTSTNLCPLFYKPDYSLANYVVLEKNDNYFKILANYSDPIYIKKESDFIFSNWDNIFLDHAVSIRIKGEKDIYNVESIKGDMLYCEEQNSGIKKNIRWRSKNQLLIEIMFLV